MACQFQKDIVVQAFGTCRGTTTSTSSCLDFILLFCNFTEDGFPGTDWPLRRYTPLQYTQSDDSNSPLSKSTRHLLMPDPRYYYERPGQLNKNGATFTVDARKTNAHPGKPFNSEYPYEDLYNTSGEVKSKTQNKNAPNDIFFNFKRFPTNSSNCSRCHCPSW